MSWRTWLDASPVSRVALALMRDATGRQAPLAPFPPLAPARGAPLPAGRAVGCWTLVGGAGASTVAALLAHRSAACGRAPLLLDLDRRAPVLALRAERGAATIADALLHPGGERALASRWGAVPFLAGAPDLHRSWDGPRLASLIASVREREAVVVDLGSGAEALDPEVLGQLDRLLVVVGPTIGQLQAAFCSIPLIDPTVECRSVVVGAAPADATRIADRLPWPLLGALPPDPFLAADRFAIRLSTQRAVDALLRGLA